MLGTHYFYWRFDLYKLNDYEPIRVYDSPVLLAASRYHWHVLVLWVEPTLHQEKPIVNFFWGVHTPVVSCRRKPKLIVLQIKDEPLESDEEYWLKTVDLPILKKLRRMGYEMDLSKISGYSDKLVSEEESYSVVTGKYIFDLSKMRVAVIVGNMPKESNLPPDLRAAIYA